MVIAKRQIADTTYVLIDTCKRIRYLVTTLLGPCQLVIMRHLTSQHT